MSYLDRLHTLKAQKCPSEERPKLPQLGSGSYGSSPSGPFSGNVVIAHSDDPDAWQAALARLDAAKPPIGFAPLRWRELVDDARWLANQNGRSAAALGWTAGDLFGLDDALDGWGGLADRLRGGRRVTFTDAVAHWHSDHEDAWLWRRTLRPMRTIWEYQS